VGARGKRAIDTGYIDVSIAGKDDVMPSPSVELALYSQRNIER
jgi:hypothetical protein